VSSRRSSMSGVRPTDWTTSGKSMPSLNMIAQQDPECAA
jgi:hypothetical protein